MDALEIQALLIRHDAACKQVAYADSELKRIELLLHVVAPSPALREASLTAAEERGVSNLARRLARDAATPEATPVPA